MKSLSENSAKISINDALRLISTFHSMHAIAGRLSPIQSENSGIETIETNTFKLQVLLLDFDISACKRSYTISLPYSASKLLQASNFFSLRIPRVLGLTPH